MSKQAGKMRHRRNRIIDENVPTDRDAKVGEIKRAQEHLDRKVFEMFGAAQNAEVWKQLQARFGPLRELTGKDDGGRVDPYATAERMGEANVIRWIMNAMARGSDNPTKD